MQKIHNIVFYEYNIITGRNVMNNKGLDFKHKEVININNAKRLGFVQDVTADFKTGTITSIIVPGNTKLFSFFSTRK